MTDDLPNFVKRQNMFTNRKLIILFFQLKRALANLLFTVAPFDPSGTRRTFFLFRVFCQPVGGYEDTSLPTLTLDSHLTPHTFASA